jgi:Endonuclease-reverse transcriptase
MLKRGTDEDVAHSFIEDVQRCIPQNTNSVVCGDWNARIGEMSPTVGDTTIPRKSLDKTTNARAQWVISICEQYGWHILNGIQPGPPACHTFGRGSDKSCIDLILSRNAKQGIQYDPATLHGLTDHILVLT